MNVLNALEIMEKGQEYKGLLRALLVDRRYQHGTSTWTCNRTGSGSNTTAFISTEEIKASLFLAFMGTW